MFSGLLILCILLIASTKLSAQAPTDREALKNGIVKIEAFYRNSPVELGTGIVIGRDVDRVYILTALHVVSKPDIMLPGSIIEPDSIKVAFFRDRSKVFPGQLFTQFNQELDVGIVTVDVSYNNPLHKNFPRIWHAEIEKLKTGDPVVLICHPMERVWEVIEGNQIQQLCYQKDCRILLISNANSGLIEGCSGGPVFNQQMHLVGIIKRVTIGDVIVVKIDLLQFVKEWGVTTNFILKIPPSGVLDKPRLVIPLINRKMSYLTGSFGLITASTLTWYFVEKENAKDELANYRDAMTTEDAVSRRIQTEKARSRCKIARNTFLSSAGVFAILLGRDLIRSKPRPVCYSLDPHLLNPTKNGLAVRFKSEPDLLALSINLQYNF